MSRSFSIAEQLLWTNVLPFESANTTALNSAGVDMAGYDGVVFLAYFDAAASNNTINAAQGLTLGGSYDDLADTEVASGSAELVWVVIEQPIDPFVRCEITRGTSSAIDFVLAIQYNAYTRVAALNIVSGASIGEIHIRPEEGTK